MKIKMILEGFLFKILESNFLNYNTFLFLFSLGSIKKKQSQQQQHTPSMMLKHYEILKQ